MALNIWGKMLEHRKACVLGNGDKGGHLTAVSPTRVSLSECA